MKYINYLILIFTALVIFSCGKNESVKNQQKDVIGKWQKAWTSTIYEFKDDGNLELHASYGIIPGKYSFPEESKIKLDFTGTSPNGIKFPSIQGNFTVEGDTLYITYEDKGYKQLLKFGKIK